MTQQTQKSKIMQILAIFVPVFFLYYGIHNMGFWLRKLYTGALVPLEVSNLGMFTIMRYFGQLFFLIPFAIYVYFEKKDRQHFLAVQPNRGNNKLYMLLLGGVAGFGMNGLCVLLANLHGDIVTAGNPAPAAFPVFLLAAAAVLVQASVEEIELRGFFMGKLRAEGTSVGAAVILSSVYFSFLHAANPGFTFRAFLSIVSCGILYALLYYMTDSLWFTCGLHMMWNYTQDFIFGLPNSGNPSAMSMLSTSIKGGSFFYDPEFGIEGSYTCIALNFLIAAVVALVIRKRKK